MAKAMPCYKQILKAHRELRFAGKVTKPLEILARLGLLHHGVQEPLRNEHPNGIFEPSLAAEPSSEVRRL